MGTRLEKLYGQSDLLKTDGNKSIIVILAMGWFLSTGVRLIYPVMIPQIRSTFELNNTGAGFFFTIILFTLAIMQFPSGLSSDRIGERSVLIFSAVGTTMGCILLSIAPVISIFFLGCVLFGFGAGLYQPPTLSILSKEYPNRTGTAHGIIFASGSIGTILLPAIAGFLALQIGWRMGFGFAIPIFLLVIGGVWKTIPETGAISTETKPFKHELRASIRAVLNRDILLVACSMAIVAIAYQALSAFLPTYFIEDKQLSQQVATTLFSLFFASAFLFQTGAGLLADKWGTRYILLLIPAISAVSIFGLTIVDDIFLLGLFTIPLSSLPAFISVANTYYISSLPDDVQAGGVGLLRSIIIGLAATSPIIVGYLADTGRFTLAFQLVGFSLVISAGVLLYSIIIARQQRSTIKT